MNKAILTTVSYFHLPVARFMGLGNFAMGK